MPRPDAQVDGKEGVEKLWGKIERRGLGVLYDGSAATLGRCVCVGGVALPYVCEGGRSELHLCFWYILGT